MSSRDAVGFGSSALSAFSLPGPKVHRETAGPIERPLAARTEIGGMDAILDGTGAVYLPATETLVVSDLHLETGSSYARTGQMLPPYDTEVTLGRLADVTAAYGPDRIIFLGDTFHDPFGAERLAPPQRAFITALGEIAELIFITGNHDHGSASIFGGIVAEEFVLDGVVFRHIPVEGMPQQPEIAGHLHPAARIVVKGRSIKRRAFVGCRRRMVVPAFGCLTGGLCVSDPAFAGLWPHPAKPDVHIIGQRKVYSLTADAATG